MVLGLALRLDFLIPCNFIIDADEAIVGLMAKHILEGKDIPTFYYGQHYMGSLEAILTAGVFKLFGISNITLKVIPLLFSILLIPLMFFIGLELKNSFTAKLAAIFTAIPPVSLIIWSGKTRGGFIELVFIGALALYLTLKALKNKVIPSNYLILISLILGLGWWVNNQIIFFIVPIVFVLFWKSWEVNLKLKEKSLFTLKNLALSLAAFIIGGLPFWVYNIKNNFVSFEMFKSAKQSDYGDHLSGLFTDSIPILLGAKRFWEANDIFPNSTTVFYLFYGIIIFFYFFSERLKIFKKESLLIVLFLLSCYGIFVLSSFGYLYQAPRYLLPSYLGIFCILALALEKIRLYSRQLAMILFLMIISLNLASAYVGGRAIPGEPVIFHFDRVAKDHQELINWLKEHQIKAIRTNYWIGYRLAFETREEIKFLVFQTPRQTRINSYREEIKAQFPEDQIPLLLSPMQTPIIETALTAMGYQFKKVGFPGYFLLYEINPLYVNPIELEKNSFKITATQHNDLTSLVLDKDLKTRWGTGEPQKPGMTFSIDLSPPQKISGISILENNYETDFPRGLEIEVEKTDQSKQLILNDGQYRALRYYQENNVFLHFQAVEASKINLIQTGSDTFFDWSISEIILEK